MSGRRSRDKGSRTERAVARLLQTEGFAATKVSGMYKPSAELRSTVAVIRCQSGASLKFYRRTEPATQIVSGTPASTEIAKRATA